MKIEVNLSRINKTRQIIIEKDSSVFDLLKKLDIKPDTAVVMKKNRPISEDVKIKENDTFTILRVSSSG